MQALTGGSIRELKILNELRHPNCISVLNSYTIYEEVEGEDKLYLNMVLQFVPNNLFSILREYKKANTNFPEILAMIYSFQLFRCLHYLKVKQLMHRDIKPQNILVDTKRHHLYMCDFGSAKYLSGKEPNTTYICSRFYRAPELLLGNDKYDTAVDLWSVGCVIAEMFMGEPFFLGKNTEEQVTKIAEVIGAPDEFDVKALVGSKKQSFDAIKPITIKKKLAGKASDLAIDLITKVLVYDPEKRIRPIDAMMHPFFDKVRQDKLVINGYEIVDLFNFLPEEIEGYNQLVNKLTPPWYFDKDKSSSSKPGGK